MAEIIPLSHTPKARSYSLDIEQYPDNLMFTLNGIKPNPESLRKVADELEKIAQIIRADVVTGAV